jgi:hypothetical protein
VTPPPGAALTVAAIEDILRLLPAPELVVYLNPQHKAELDARASAEAPLTHLRVGDGMPLRRIITSETVPYGVCVTMKQ